MTGTVLQVSVFLANEPKQLSRVTKLLSNEEVNLRAFSIIESGVFGIIRMITNDTDKAYGVLKERGFTVSQTDVIAIQIPDSIGALNRIAEALGDDGVNINYSYAGLAGKGGVLLILKLDQVEQGLEILGNLGVKIIGQDELK